MKKNYKISKLIIYLIDLSVYLAFLFISLKFLNIFQDFSSILSIILLGFAFSLFFLNSIFLIKFKHGFRRFVGSRRLVKISGEKAIKTGLSELIVSLILIVVLTLSLTLINH